MDKSLQLPILKVPTEQAAVDVLDALKIPIVGTIYPLPDSVYSHTFKMPACHTVVGYRPTRTGDNHDGL